MKYSVRFCIILLPAVFLQSGAAGAADPFLWLEEVGGERAMAWVEAHNTLTTGLLTREAEFAALKERCLEIYNSDERIAYPSIRQDSIFNFWQSAVAERGVWRRTTVEGYLSGRPDWDTLLDLDALSEAEGETWAYKGVNVLEPAGDRVLVRLSRGGSDAVEIREFELAGKTFVTNGFFVPEAKSGTAWLDKDTLLIGTDFGAGSMTASGYPRVVKKWKRGTPLSEAETLFEGQAEDVSVSPTVYHNPERTYAFIARSIAFYNTEFYAIEDGSIVKLDLPSDAEVPGLLKGQLLVELKSDWELDGRTYSRGMLVSVDYNKLLEGKHQVAILHLAKERTSLADVSTTKNRVLITVYVRGQYDEMYQCTYRDGSWVKTPVHVPGHGTLSVVSADDYSDRYFFLYESMLAPRSLYYMSDEKRPSRRICQLPAFFDIEGLTLRFHEAVSKDGTRVPYTVIMNGDAALDGSNPTLLYGYGGFEVSLRPRYSPITGASWLSRGGIYVEAHIRGGGEFGPQWHQAAKKENRQRAYDDFIAVSEDLIRRGYCSRRTLGIMGGSNGGLLVGVAATQRPELYRAVVCSVPLLDMKRFNKLLAGASWMGEYGNPDVPEEWAYISTYSPYHNIDKDQDYPRILFITSTRDDRVHPAHARKMAARMEALGKPVYYYENTEGGHGAGVTNDQRAYMRSLIYAYLLKMLR